MVAAATIPGSTTDSAICRRRLKAYLKSGARISQGGVDTQAIARQLVDGGNSVIQRNPQLPVNSQLPVNLSGNLTGGTSFEIGGDTRIGLIATAGYSNAWRTRDTTQQTAQQSVDPVQVFTTPTVSAASTLLNRNYFLPAATLTYQVIPDVQFRLNASKTIARPQFRELIFQRFHDPDTNRQYRGNPLLTDGQLDNGEGRLDWYFAKDQRIAVAGFYKRIEHPIGTYASVTANDITSSFVDAPRANLYGAEVEAQKYFELDRLGALFASRRLVTIANYTFTKSKIIVRPTDGAASLLSPGAVLASDYIRNGGPLTAQSNHIPNIQLGLEAKDHLSQQTFLLNYANKRVTNRGASGQPDTFEYPGFHLDFVAREAVLFAGLNTEVKFEVRNITGTKYQEYQQLGANRIYYNRYRVGTSAFVSAGIKY